MSQYKVLAKVLSLRIREALHDPLIPHQVIWSGGVEKKEGIIFKIDFG